MQMNDVFLLAFNKYYLSSYYAPGIDSSKVLRIQQQVKQKRNPWSLDLINGFI